MLFYRHLKEDIKDRYHVDIDEKTSDHELDFYYFKMHDFDNNKQLDGLEILMALNHIIDYEALENKLRSGDKVKIDDPVELVVQIQRHQRVWNNKFADDSSK